MERSHSIDALLHPEHAVELRPLFGFDHYVYIYILLLAVGKPKIESECWVLLSSEIECLHRMATPCREQILYIAPEK